MEELIQIGNFAFLVIYSKGSKATFVEVSRKYTGVIDLDENKIVTGSGYDAEYDKAQKELIQRVTIILEQMRAVEN